MQVAIVRHHGESWRDGHYTAFSKHGEQWFDCNDKIVKPVTWANVRAMAREDAYLVVLRRKVTLILDSIIIVG